MSNTLLDLSPLRENRPFRYLYIGNFISFLGAMMAYVAIPYQVYQITKSSAAVGLISLCQLVPVLFTALIGGAYADRANRRNVILISEVVLVLSSLGLMINSMQAEPSLLAIYIFAGISMAATGFQRPAFESATQSILTKDQMMRVSILNSFKGNICMIGGPAIGGLIVAHHGAKMAYLIDAVSYAASMLSVIMAGKFPRLESAEAPKKTLASIIEGLKYAKSRQEILGTYLIDFACMVFAMPNALFPALAELHGGAKVLGWFYSANSVGALICNLTSGWSKKVQRHGAAVSIAAAFWGVAIVCVGLSTNLYVSLFFLVVAGAADMVSVIFRMTIWNQTIPNNLRGRLAGMEMISYMSGPMLGNAGAGFVAGALGIGTALVMGGTMCVVAVTAATLALPAYWKYRDNTTAQS